MAKTIVGLADPKAVKRYSGALAVEAARESYWHNRFMGEGETAQTPIQRLTELENDAGEQITFDLSMKLAQQPIEGDDTQEGTEEALQFYTDAVYVDQMRGGVNSGGRMTRKRTLHDLRKVAKSRQAEWWAEAMDQMVFIYLSGARGVNKDFNAWPLGWSGRANNALSAPDSAHHVFPGAKVKGTLEATDKLTTAEIDKALEKSKMIDETGTPRLKPIKINGEKHYVLVMSTFQARDLRTSSGTGNWLDIQKQAASAEGRKNPIFKGGLGMYNNVVLHEHENTIRFDDYGSGGDVAAARALFLGVQAGVLAYGSPGTGFRYDWHEEARDNGNQVVITTGAILGFKKCTFNGLDFGVIAVDTAAVKS